MQYKKPLIFIYPISDTLRNLKKAIEVSGQAIEIFEIEDLREVLQTVPSIGQSLILGSNAKKCAKFLQAGKKINKNMGTKILIISQKEYPRKTVDKLMKLGLTDIIFEPVPPKTLMYKVNLTLRALKVPTKEELEKRFKAEQAAKKDEENKKSKDTDKPIAIEEDQEFSKESNDNPNENNENTDPDFNSLRQEEDSGFLENEDPDFSSLRQEEDSGFLETEDPDFDTLKKIDDTSAVENMGEDLESLEQDKDAEETEEDLLNSLSSQTLAKSNTSQDQSALESLSHLAEDNLDHLTESEFQQEEDEEDDEDSLLESISNQSLQSTQEQDSNFESLSADAGHTEQKVEKSFENFPSDASEEELNNNELSLLEQKQTNDDNEDSTKIQSNDEDTEQSTEINGETDEINTHMQGEGSTEHIEDEEHQMSDSDMEFEEMAALSEISNLETKMRGDSQAEETIDDLMQGQLGKSENIDTMMSDELGGQDTAIDANMRGELLSTLEEDNDLKGEVMPESPIDSNMRGHNQSEEISATDLQGSISQEANIDGSMQGDILSSLEEESDLTGEVHSQEENIKTHYDANGIDHTKQQDPLAHDASNDVIEDESNSIAQDEVDLDDLLGEAKVDEVSGNLKGNILDNPEQSNGFDAIISDEQNLDNLSGSNNTDHLPKDDWSGENNSFETNKGNLKGQTTEGAEHIETNYGTDFGSKQNQNTNPLMESDFEEDDYGTSQFHEQKKNPQLEMQEDLYENSTHTNSLSKDKAKRQTDDFTDDHGENETNELTLEDDAKNPHKFETNSSIDEIKDSDDHQQDSNKSNPLQYEDTTEEGSHEGKPRKNKDILEMQYELETQWGDKAPIKEAYTFSDEPDRERKKKENPKMSFDDQYEIYDETDLDSLINNFTSDEDFGEEQRDELKEMAKDLESSPQIIAPETLTELSHLEKVSTEKNILNENLIKTQESTVKVLDPTLAGGLDTLIRLSQIYQTITLKSKDAIYQSAKILYDEHGALSCFIQVDKNSELKETYNAIIDPIISEDFLEQAEWDKIRIKTFNDIQQKSYAFWEGSDQIDVPKIFVSPCYQNNFLYSINIFYFPNDIQKSKQAVIESLAESMKLVSYESLPQSHFLKNSNKENEQDVFEKESVLKKVGSFYKKNFVPTETENGKKKSRFGSWVRNKIEKIAS